MIETAALLIIFFGSLNLIRITIFVIGADIYAYRSNSRKEYRPSSYPTMSIIIPAHNEEKNIISTVKSVVRNNYPINKREIIVIDDGSVDKTY